MNDVMIQDENQNMLIEREVVGLNQLMEYANFISKSTIVPTQYMNRPENCLVALDMSTRMGVSPMMVMQNLYVIQGKPSWSGTAIGALIRNCGYFKDVEVNYVGQENTDNWGCYITAKHGSTGKPLKGAKVTIGIAKAEGWYGKAGSKWKTIPEQMLAYRAYAWFARVHAPELLMGLHSNDEVQDMSGEERVVVENPFTK